MEKLKILYVEDDPGNREELKEALQDEIVNGYSIDLNCEESFEGAADKAQGYNLVILDVLKGKDDDLGSCVYDEIKRNFFTPIIFYSAKTTEVEALKSQIVGVASKIDGFDALKAEIDRLTKHGLPLLKERVHCFIEKEFNLFFWDTIQARNDIFKAGEEDFSLAYLLLRRFSDALSKDKIKEILKDDIINDEKVHPMEFYLYPTDLTREYECGEVVNKGEDYYVILTPSCDFVNRPRKAEHILLAKAMALGSNKEYNKESNAINNENNKIKDYKEQLLKCSSSDKKKELEDKINKCKQSISNHISSISQFMNSGRSDRYFFLPGTPFIDNRVIDFQDTMVISYDTLKTDYARIVKLDNPYAQSMISSFIRYYNRIGFPDLDTKYIMRRIGIRNDDTE